MFKQRYRVYKYTGHDPVLDRLVLLFNAARIKPHDWAKASDVSLSQIYKIIRTTKGSNKLNTAKTVTFPTLMRLCIGLGAALEDLKANAEAGRASVTNGARASRRPKLRVVA